MFETTKSKAFITNIKMAPQSLQNYFLLNYLCFAKFKTCKCFSLSAYELKYQKYTRVSVSEDTHAAISCFCNFFLFVIAPLSYHTHLKILMQWFLVRRATSIIIISSWCTSSSYESATFFVKTSNTSNTFYILQIWMHKKLISVFRKNHLYIFESIKINVNILWFFIWK